MLGYSLGGSRIGDTGGGGRENDRLRRNRFESSLEKTGETPFIFETLDIGMDPNVFLPMQQLNEMRRRALAELEKQICRQYHRELRANPENRAVFLRPGRDCIQEYK